MERLKAELDNGEGREVSGGSRSGVSSAHVGFRLDRYYAERLAEDGKKLGLSPGEYARKLVINSIEDTRDERLKDEIRGLRLGLASAIYEVSVRGLGLTAEQAESLVARSILKGVRGA